MSVQRIDILRMVDPVLTTIAQGYANSSMVADSLFPIVKVQKLKGKIPSFGKESFIIRDTMRAMRAGSNRIPPSDWQFLTFETRERDVEIAIDYIEEEESADFLRYEQRITRQLSDILLLGREKEVADLVQNSSLYPSGMKLQINSDNAFNNYASTSDPIKIIRDAATAIRNKISCYPNTMIIGDSCYQQLVRHPKLLENVRYAGLSKITSDILSELTEIRDIKVGLSVYSGDGVNFSDVWSDNIILAYVDKSEKNTRSEFEPCFGYTLQRSDKPEVDTYYENGGKIKVIRCTDNYCVKITAPDAAFLIYDTNH